MNGKAALNGVVLGDLWAPTFIDALLELNMQDAMHEKEVTEHIQKTRAEIMSRFNRYDSNQSYGMTNDNIGATTSDEPLPYIEPTVQTDDGYLGLDPPMN